MPLRLTTKVKTKIHLTSFDPEPKETEPSFLSEWYVNLFNISTKRYLILTEAVTLYSFVVSSNGINKRKDLEQLATDQLFEVFKRYLGRLPQELFERNAESVIMCKTASRRILGSQNGLVWMAVAGYQYDGRVDFDSLNETPMSMIKNSPRVALDNEVEKDSTNRNKRKVLKDGSACLCRLEGKSVELRSVACCP